MRRYDRAPIIKNNSQYGTVHPGSVIRAAVEAGSLPHKRLVLREGDRLDTIAGREYGNAGLWWVIAGASAIGWSLQVPPGTLIIVPTDLGKVAGLVS